MGWNEQVLALLESIRNNGTPEGDNSGAVNLKLNDVPVGAANPLPISDGGGSITIDGAVAISSLPAIGGAVAVTNFPATQQVAGAVTVGNFPATQQVAGAVTVGNFPATQQVAGAVTVSNLPAALLAYENFGAAPSGLVKSGAGNLHSFFAVNFSTANTRFLLLFDRSTLPSTGDVPVLFFPVAGSETVCLDAQFFGAMGRSFSTGLVWAWSNTPKTFSAVQSPSEHSIFVNYR